MKTEYKLMALGAATGLAIGGLFGLLLLLAGCAAPKSKPSNSDTPAFISDLRFSNLELRALENGAGIQSVVTPPTMRVHWGASELFGDGSEYVLLSSTDLVNWATLAVTTNTKVVTPRKAWEFYRLYATNTVTGSNYWSITVTNS